MDITSTAAPPPKGADVAATESFAETTREKLPAAADAPASGSATAEGAADAQTGETDYGTNNQVESVDEADVTKSDGTNVYAAYGDKIVAFDATTGKKYAEVTVPEPYYEERDCSYPPYGPMPEPIPRPMPVVEEVVAAEAVEEEAVAAPEEGASAESVPTASKRSFIRPGCWKPRAQVLKLLLHGDRLVAFVSGYGERDWVYPIIPLGEDGQATDDDAAAPILSEYGNVQMFAYSTSSLVQPKEGDDGPPEMELLVRRDLPGRLSDARSVGSIGHAVTLTTVDTHTHLLRYFYSYSPEYAQVTNGDEYVETAREVAEVRVPEFVDRLLGELKARHGDRCQGIARLAAFQTGELQEEARVQRWWGNGIFGALATVSTFDIAGDVDIATDLMSSGTKYAACFMPNSWQTTIYATRNKLFLAGRGHDTIKEEPGFIDSTLFYGYHLSEGTVEAAAPFGVAKVDGSVLNQFSMDFDERTQTLRVAASVPQWNGCLVERDVWGGCGRWGVIREIRNTVSIFDVASAAENDGDDGGGGMPKLAESEHLGKPGERVMAVRFLGNYGYVVTFRQTDPFYVLSLEDPSDPVVKGELEISGFSSYLHPTGDDETIVAVGHNATEMGRRQALMITLFDVKNASDPVDLQRYELADKGSTSAVNFDHKAFRFLPGSGTLILPARARDGKSVFKGFYIFRVSREEIGLLGTVNLAPGYSATQKCTYDACLQPRSMVFDNQAVMMRGHYATSRYIFEPQDENWTLDLDQDLAEEECVPDYYCW